MEGQAGASAETSLNDRGSDCSFGAGASGVDPNPSSPPNQNQMVMRQLLPSPFCGARCQKCNSQGKVGLNKESRLPYLTKVFYILPNCGHSVCDSCRKKFFAEQICRICEPYTITTNNKTACAIDETDTPINYVMAGLTVLNKTGFEEIHSNTIGAKFKRATLRKRTIGSNAMFGLARNDKTVERIDCANCAKEQATVMCDHCIVLLCEVCFDFIHAERNDNHQAISFTKSVKPIEKCSEHPIRDIEFVCQTCDVKLCTDCLIDDNSTGKHVGHKMERLNRTENQTLDPNLIVENARKMYEELETSHSLADNLAARIEGMAERKSKELNMRYMQLLGLLQLNLKREHFKLKEYAQQKLFDVKRAQETVENLKTYLDEMIQSVESNNLSSAELFDNLNNLSEVVSIPSCFTSVFDECADPFGLNFEPLEDCVKKAGHVEIKEQHPLVALYDYEHQNLKGSSEVTELENTIAKRNCKPNVKKLDGLSLESATLTHWSSCTTPFVQVDDVIKVTHLRSPSEFFFILTCHENDMNVLKQRIQSVVENPNNNVANLRSLTKLEKGHFVLAKFIDDCWYRAKVISPIGTMQKFPNAVVVQFLDYGNKAHCEVNEIKVPSSQYMLHRTPPFAHEASMLNLVPKFEHGQRKPRWSESALHRFKELVEDKNLIIKNLSRLENGKFLMDMYEIENVVEGVTLYHDFPASVCKSMVFTRHASFKDRNRAPTSNVMYPQMPFSLNQFNLSPFPSKVEYRVAVLEYQNPSMFYCRVAEAREAKQQATLLDEIQAFIESFSMRPEICILCPYPGMYCLAQFEMDDSIAFYRAIVLETRFDADIRVFFIDFGNTEMVKLNQLRKIPLKLLTDYPSVLMKCKLANIRPALGKPLWDKNAIDEVKKMILNRSAKLRVVSCDEARLYSVELFLHMTKRGQPENVADILAKKKVVAKVSGLSGSFDSLAEHTDSDNPLDGATGNTRPSSSNSNSNNANTSQISPQLPSNGMRMIRVVDFNSPWSFFVRIMDNNGSDPLEMINDDLKLMDSEGQFLQIEEQSSERRSGSGQSLVVLTSVYETEPATYCRCITENVNESLDETSDFWEVFLIDYGITKRVPKTDIFTCDQSSSVDGLAFQVSLKAVSPAGSSDGTWSFNSKEAMQRLIADNDLYIDENELLERRVTSSSKISEHVDFPEIYHIDPKSSNSATVRSKDDFVPVSYFLKINGLAITNKSLPHSKHLTLSTENERSMVSKNSKKTPQIVWSQPNEGFDADDDDESDEDLDADELRTNEQQKHFIALSGSVVRPKMRERSQMKRSVVNHQNSTKDLQDSFRDQKASTSKTVSQPESRGMENCIEDKNGQCDLTSTEQEDKSLEKQETSDFGDSEDDNDDDEAAAPTVVFVNPSLNRRSLIPSRQKGKSEVKPEPGTCTSVAMNSMELEQVPEFRTTKGENDEVLISDSFLDQWGKHVDEMKDTVDAEQFRISEDTSKRAKRGEIVFPQPSSLTSPSPAKAPLQPKLKVEDTVEHVRLWNENDYAARIFRENQVENPEFDLTLHEIKEYTETDYSGDTQTVVPIMRNSFYKTLEVPKIGMHEIQFEDFGKDGVTLFGVYKDLNEFLKSRINKEVDNFINDRYVGGGYRATELYENMAACALFPEDRKWYRAIFRGKIEDKFLVRFADFGNEKSLRRNEMLPLAAFPDVPALHSVFKLLGIKSTEQEGTVLNRHKLYISKMKDRILNEKVKVFVGVKGKVVEEEEKYLCSVYSPEFFDLRHSLVNEGYFAWAFKTPANLTVEENTWFEKVVKLTMPFNYLRYENLINEVVEMKVLKAVSEKFIFAQFHSSKETDVFNSFMLGLSIKMPDERWRIVDNESSVGQLVYVYDREIMERCVFHRGQVLDFEVDEEGRRYFDIFLIDFGVMKKIPPSLSVNKVHNLEQFFDFPARAVPVLFNMQSSSTSGKELKTGDVFKAEVESVNQFLTVNKI